MYLVQKSLNHAKPSVMVLGRTTVTLMTVWLAMVVEVKVGG